MNILKYPEKGRISPEGIIIEWNKQEGDSVQKGDPLLRAESAGAILEIEAVTDGFLLKRMVDVGSFVVSGQSLALIGNKDEDISQALEEAGEVSPAVKPLSVQAKAKSTPVVSKSTQASSAPASTDAAVQQTPPSLTPQQTERIVPIVMPQAGQSMEEGTILSWKVKEGDTVSVGQVIMEIETDKATMEVEAVNAGRITKIEAAEGSIVKVKEPVAYLAWQGGAETTDPAQSPAPAAEPANATVQSAPQATAPATPLQQEQTQTPPAQSTPPASEGEVIPILMPQAGQSMEEGTLLSWKVSVGDQVQVGQILMEIETDKATVEVEAENAGRITEIVVPEGQVVRIKEPVAYIAAEGVQANTTAAPASAPVAEPAPVPAQTDSVQEIPAATTDSSDMKIHPLAKMRRAIAKNLLYSKQNVPHFYAKKTIDAGLLFTTYRKTKEQFKCSVNDFVTKACAMAIRQYPPFRSQYKETEVHENPAVNIGIAVGTDEGLTVPVVLNADQMNLEQLAAHTRQIVENARNGKLEGFGQGVFTITNLGMFGCGEFSAIINPPESAILAVGAIVEGVKVENEQMRPTRLMTMTLSVDHRVIDGVLAAQFLNTLQELLENPEQLIS